MPKTSKDVEKLAKDANVQIIDLRFVDLPGVWQHFSLPARDLSDDMFTDGLGFDGSSIRGYQQIQESDMLLFPDPDTAFVDPVLQVPTLSMICGVRDPVTRERYTRDPRHIAQKAEDYLKSTGIADISYWGPEAEFYIFDDVRYDQSAQGGYYFIDSVEGVWNTGRQESPNLGYKLRHKEGYFPCPPADQFQDLRSEMILTLEKVGVQTEIHHHEVGTAGQAEIDMRFGPLTKLADSLMYYKYIIRNVARKHGKVVTFMPKPIFGDNGSGMHCHQSLWKGETNLFWDEKGYGQISEMARHYIGGLLKHSSALLAPALRPPTRTAGWYQAMKLRSTWFTPSAEPLGGRANPDLLEEPEVEADRVPLPGSVLQPLPRLLRHAHGRAGWRPEQDRPGRSDRQGPVRPRARGSREGQEHPGLAGRGARRLGR